MIAVSDPGKQYKKVKFAHEGGVLMKGLQPLGSHFGRTKCVVLIAKRYYWPGITVNVVKYLASCHRGQSN